MQGKNNGEEENRVKKTEDSSFSLLLHFWSTYRSPFSTCYIPFQSSGSQESNALNRVRFEAEMRKIWPSEDNCSRLVRKFRTTPYVVRNSHDTLCCAKFAQHLQNSHSPCVVRIFLCFCRLHFRYFPMYFFLCNFLSYPCN